MDDHIQITSDLEQLSVSKSYVCSPENCFSYLPDLRNSLKIFHVNIRSIGNSTNFDNLLLLLHRINFNFDVLILTECWLSKCPHLPYLPGYTYSKSSCNNQNDGVVIYVRQDIALIIEEPCISDANCLVLTLPGEIKILAIYRSPSYLNPTSFFNSLDTLLSSLRSNNTIAIIGDININILLDNDNDCDRYLNLAASHAMLPAHSFPTRNSNCLDHVLLKTNKPAVTLVLDSLFTDHAPVIFYCETGNGLRKTPPTRTCPRTDISAIVKELGNMDFSKIVECVDAEVACSMLVENISATVISHTHVVRVPSRKRISKPWITSGLLRCIRHRDKLYHKTRKYPDNEIINVTYKRYKQFCNNLLKKVKREYEKNEFEKNKKNPKKTWEVIKKLANLNKPASNSELLTLCQNHMESVNEVNKHFANVGKTIALQSINELPLADLPPSSAPVNTNLPNSMFLFETNCDEIESIIIGLKQDCAVGWDGISTTLVKAAKHILSPILNHVFNLCICSGKFPKVFKKGIVHPIFKGGDRYSVNNYRPISVLSTLSKIFEKIINKRLINYLTCNNILATNQYGFRQNKSTEDAVLELTTSVATNINSNFKTVSILLDLCKAFDTVSIPTLLNKLLHLGIRGVAFSMFESYLNERSQYVVIDNIISKEETIAYGVPQGSVLGPTLFLIYINDLCFLPLKNCRIITYADDTALVVHGSSWSEARECAELALRYVMNWLNHNRLTLNLSKTQFITFSPRLVSQPDSTFTIRAHQCRLDSIDQCKCIAISRTHTVKYLGVVIDSTLTFKDHISMVVSRVRKLIFVFRKLRGCVDQNTLRTVYFALAHSILSYCITAWGSAAKTHIFRLERAQRAVLKVMTSKPMTYPTSMLYDLCRILSVRKTFVLNSITRKHALTPFDADLFNGKRISYKVCKTERSLFILTSRQFHYLSPFLYNKLNKILNIYPLTSRECKKRLMQWLQGQDYDNVESFICN